jgi:hypothetical protein
MRALDRLRAELAPIEPLIREGRFFARLTCSICGGHDEWSSLHAPASNIIRKKCADKGWAIGRRLSCPTCTAKSKEANMPNATKPAINMEAIGKVHKLLGKHFNNETGQFDAGWSDQKVASETGLAPDAVAAFRKASFGELKEAPEVAALRGDIASLAQLYKEHADTMVKEIAALRTRLQKIAPVTP